jgi:hypothetical protein
MTRPLLLAFIFALAGCGGTIHPPAHVDEPTVIYAKSEGRHSSILLPAGRAHPPGTLVEYTYGDWRWFALVQTRWDVALVAMFSSPQATLGRRIVAPPQPGELPDASEGVMILPITVDRRRAEALRLTLDARFGRGIETLMYNPTYKTWFVHDAERYHASNNCNHLTARWLRRLGCRVEGATFTNDFRLKGAAASRNGACEATSEDP